MVKIFGFSAEFDFVCKDVPFAVSWETLHADSVVLKGYGEQQANGSVKVHVAKDSVFELFVRDKNGHTQTAKCAVHVMPAPTLLNFRPPYFDDANELIVETEVAKVDIINQIRINVPQVGSNVVSRARVGIPDVVNAHPRVSLSRQTSAKPPRLSMRLNESPSKGICKSLRDILGELLREMKTNSSIVNR